MRAAPDKGRRRPPTEREHPAGPGRVLHIGVHGMITIITIPVPILNMGLQLQSFIEIAPLCTIAAKRRHRGCHDAS